jgi:hypothetical protein
MHFILSSARIRIQKIKLCGQIFKTNHVSKYVNLNKILKSDLGYKELSHMKTSLDYLDWLQKDVFAMNEQFGPPTFFVTFTTCVNNWPILEKH